MTNVLDPKMEAKASSGLVGSEESDLCLTVFSQVLSVILDVVDCDLWHGCFPLLFGLVVTEQSAEIDACTALNDF